MQSDVKLYTVGELARRCGVTVRTLQFYDVEGLLAPKHYTEGGRRLYGREDIIRLQQILFLKSFGFSLDEIRDRVLNVSSPQEIADLLMRQQRTIADQIDKMNETVEFLEKIIAEIRRSGDLSTEKLVAIIEIMKSGSPYWFVLRYFSQKEMETIVKRYDEENKPKGIDTRWQGLFSQVISLHKNGADPEGAQGQELAKNWWTLVREFTDDDPEMIKTLMNMGKDVDNWPNETGEIKDAVKVFLAKALEKYLRESAMAANAAERV